MDQLPEDVIIVLCSYLNPKSVVSLMLVNTSLHRLIKGSRKVIKKVLRDLSVESSENDEVETFKRFFEIRSDTVSKIPVTQRTYADIGQSSDKDYMCKRLNGTDDHCESHSLDKKGASTSDWLTVKASKNKRARQALDSLIRDGNYAFVFNDDFFVLVKSYDAVPGHNSSSGSQLDVFKHSQGLSKLLVRTHLSYFVESQDMCIIDGYLFVLPLQYHQESQPILLRVYDLEKRCGKFDIFTFDLHKHFDDDSINRNLPFVRKESGENRIYHVPSYELHTNYIVVVVPIGREWRIFVFKMTQYPEQDASSKRRKQEPKFSLVKDQMLPNASIEHVGQLFTADSKPPVLLLNFFGKPLNLIEPIDQSATNFTRPFFVIVKFLPKLSIETFENEGFLMGERYDLNNSIEELQHYLSCATNHGLAYYDQKNLIDIKSNPARPVAVFLLASDRLIVCSGVQQIATVSPICESTSYNPSDWHMSEVLVHGRKVIVSQLRTGPKKQTYINCFDLDGLQKLWAIVPTILGGRLFLYCDMDLLWISVADSCSIMSLETGKIIRSLDFVPYKRWSKEITSSCVDTSPYSQTGQSVWAISRLTDGRVIIVHDIERFAPVLFESCLTFWIIQTVLQKKNTSSFAKICKLKILKKI